MKSAFAAAMFLLISFIEITFAAPITTVTVREKAGISTAGYPLTFGMVFKQGDAPQTVAIEIGGNRVTTQADVKTRYVDGSVRHAIISAVIPTTANADTVLRLVSASSSATSGEMSKTAMLITEVGAIINLTNLSGSNYSGNLSANLRNALNSVVTPDYWLKGEICSGVLLTQPLNNSLNASWEVRFYPQTPYIYISNVIENVASNYRGRITYDAAILMGNSPIEVWRKSSVPHILASRWRKGFWLPSNPPPIEIVYDLTYLVRTGHIPNYDQSMAITESSIAAMYNTWSTRNTDIYGSNYTGGNWYSGLAAKYFPATGGRAEIGIFPQWAAMYLLTWDNRLREILLGQADLYANAPVHYREYDATKALGNETDRHIISIDGRPRINLANESTITSTAYDPLPAAIGDTTSDNWSIDRAHQSSIAFLPYMVTGEYFYLQEMYYWAGWDLAASNFNPDWGRNYSLGLLRDQVRGEAWAVRNIAHAAILAPDSHVEKSYFDEKLQNNLTQWITDSAFYPLRHISLSEGSPSGVSPTVANVTSPWMEDYFLIALHAVDRLGYETDAISREHSKFIINRFTHPDFNWYNGAPYRFPTKLTDGSMVSSWAQADALFSSHPTSWNPLNYAFSYRDVASAALSTAIHYNGGRAAYEWVMAHIPSSDLALRSSDPTWALVPIEESNQSDLESPILNLISPSGTLPAGTTSALISLSTNEAATCRVASSSSTGYDGATNLTTTGDTSHSYTLGGLTNGNSYTRYIWCRDAAGNTGGPLNVTFSVANAVIPDTTAPIVSAFTMPAIAISLNVAVTAFTATDAVGVTGYMITESSSAPAAGAAGWTATAPTSFTFSGAGTRTAYAWAKDAAGNVSASLSRNVTITLADTTAPSVSISSPASQAALKGTVTVSATATDNVGITKVDFFVDGSLIGSDSSSPYNISWNTASVSSGAHTLTACAYDAAGNVTTSAAVPITLRRLPRAPLLTRVR